jgi:tripartite-type tricarboxylate transporter receptor subunit TctC
MTKRLLAAVLAVAALAAAGAWTGGARAETYPSRPIKLMVGFPPGGNVDSVGRVLAQEMSKGLGEPVVVENKPGVVGSLAAELVAKSPPDGYTLMVVAGAHPVNAAIHKSIPYDPVNDFAWISMVTSYPFAFSVRAQSPFHSLADLIAAARAKPGMISNGSSGAGSVQHMTAELLGQAAGVHFLEVPYKGEALALPAALSGEVDFVVTTTTLVVPFIGSGKLRPLAVTSARRWKELPNVPTVQEAGIKDFEVTSWSGLAAPHGTPPAIIQRLNAEVRRTLAVPDVKKRLESFGGDVQASTPDEMKAQIAREVARWTALVRETNMPRI